MAQHLTRPAPAPVWFLGGNGHCSARLDGVRAAAPELPLVEARYPGFEGRPRARDLDAFLDALEPPPAPGLVVATGIGALVALALRARGQLVDTPLVFQGPVLWGLEHRWFPRLMRVPPLRRLGTLLIRSRAFRRRFVRRHFLRPTDGATQRAFFRGYDECAAFADFFRWFTPAFLRRLERDLTPERTRRVEVWVGGRETVVGRRELEATHAALGVGWPLRVFPDWGHYPMVDDPAGWAREVEDALARAVRVF